MPPIDKTLAAADMGRKCSVQAMGAKLIYHDEENVTPRGLHRRIRSVTSRKRERGGVRICGSFAASSQRRRRKPSGA